MSDYIERQKVKDIRFSGGINHDGFLYVPYKELVDGIKALPPADVIPVVHSQWIKTEDGAECENCGREVVYQIVDDHWEYEPWCPHCGAKMDGEKRKE